MKQLLSFLLAFLLCWPSLAFAQGDATGDDTTQNDPNDPNDPNDGSDAATEAQIDWTFELQDATNAANYTFQSTTNGDETFVAASDNTDVKTGSLGANTSKGSSKYSSTAKRLSLAISNTPSSTPRMARTIFSSRKTNQLKPI